MNIRNTLQEKWSDKYISECKLGNKKYIFNIFQRVGKIRLSLLCIKKLNLINPKILIIYSDNSIKNSWEEDIIKFNYIGLDVTYCNHASLSKHIDKHWDILISDEHHNIDSDERILNFTLIFKNSEYVIGLSGTISKEKEEESLFLYNLPILIKYNKEQAISDGIVADYEIEVRYVELDNIQKTKNTKGKYVTELDKYKNFTWVIENKPKNDIITFSRNRLIQQSIAKKNEILKCIEKYHDKRIIIFTGYEKTAEKLGIDYFHGKSKNNEIIQKFNNKEISKLALVVKGSIGTTYKDLDIVILSNFTGNFAKNEQALTRSSIKDYGTKVSKFIIICTKTKSEMNKLKETLKEFDSKKIKYINNE